MGIQRFGADRQWRSHLRRWAWVFVGILLAWGLSVYSIPGLERKAIAQEGFQEAAPENVQENPPESIPESASANSNSVSSFLNQGRDAYASGDYEAAVQHWQTAASMADRVGNSSQRAIASTYLSLAYQQMQDWTRAEDTIQTAIALLTSDPDSRPATSTLPYAQALNARGRLDLAMGRSQSALDTWQRATEIYRQLGDRSGITGGLLNQVQALENLGFYRQACNTVFDAIELDIDCTLTSQEAVEQVLNHVSATLTPSIQLISMQSLGNLLRRIGNLDASYQLLEQGLEVSQTLSLPRSESEMLLSLGDTERSRYLKTRSLFERTRDDVNRNQARHYGLQALDHYRQAAAIASTTNLSVLSIQAQLQRLSLLSDLEHWLRSQNRLRVAEAIRPQIQSQWAEVRDGVENLPPSHAAIDARLDLAQTLMNLEQRQQLQTISDEAIAAAMTALQQAETLHIPRAESYARGTLGMIYEQIGDRNPQLAHASWQQSREWTQPALGLAQAHQAWDIAYRWQWQLGRLYRKQGNSEEAIAHYDAAVQTLQTVRQNLLSVDSEIRFSFRDNVEPIYRELVELLLNTNGAAPSQANLQAAIQDIDALQVSELENFLRCDLSPSLEISDANVDPRAAILYPIILENQLAVILKSPQSDRLHFYAVSRPKAEVDAALIHLRQELEKPYPSQQGRALGMQVYDWLIRPAESILTAAQVETLVFVLDGALRNVPMAALYDGEHYLIEHYAIALMPGLQLIEPKPLTQVQLDVLKFGLSEIRPNFPAHQGFAALENVETELNQVGAQTSGRRLLNQDFTSDRLQQLATTTSFPIIHLATHGQFSSEPEDTFILAWDKRVNINALSAILQDRSQRADAIELLVLSACKTADGDSRAALGLAGVAVQSGARSTLASLWYVDDQGTAELMSHFYQELAGTDTLITKAEALRRSQLALLHNPYYRSPIYWAPYVLVGNWL
ncbi:MAG: CHAT domain-containing protein [Elainellaceae cyanobacterium]